jgi:hypothetical protein
MKKVLKTVEVNNKMQKGYKYELSEPTGANFHPDFKPAFNPKEMLELGVFGGKYMNDCVGTDEYPENWFKKAKMAGINGKYDKNLNYFGVKASLSLKDWVKSGWINKNDPRGWFEWYCRYYMGRRIEDEDDRQIKRWIKMRRHLYAVAGNCRPKDHSCRPRQRQALLHWAYDSISL